MQPNAMLLGNLGQSLYQRTINGLSGIACAIDVERTRIPQLRKHHHIGLLGSLGRHSKHPGNPR
jgi:hypothetical protein